MATQAQRSAATVAEIVRSARQLFMEKGYSAVSMDEIAAEAGVAKGAIYHHFKSKLQIFDSVFNEAQSELAKELAARIAANSGRRTPQTVSRNIFIYLQAATRPGWHRLILVDGPVVLGWERWREIDDNHFIGFLRSGLEAFMPDGTNAAEIDSATQLMAGAIIEAALKVGASSAPTETARQHCRTLELFMTGLQKAGL